MFPDIQIISVLGVPGSGKGTQCSLLQSNFRCAHFSIGDLLRAEVNNPDSAFRELIQENLRLGLLGPKEMTVGILKSHIEAAYHQGVRTFFLDGFPRKLDTEEYFEQLIGPISLVLLLDCEHKTLIQRLLSRKRSDDTEETIAKRVSTFQTSTVEVLAKYDAAGKLARIRAEGSTEDVFAQIQKALKSAGLSLDTIN